MKRLIVSMLIGCLLLGLTYINAQERRERKEGARFQVERKEGAFGEAFEIRRKMREIEIQTIQADPELKRLDEQIKQLQKQLEEKLQQKLSSNQEYQELKRKQEEMQKEWRERIKERQGEQEKK
ncbi:MAG: hypothetical protein NC827_02360 [Candidatus Omnitrophica bacterium]|nr:hypothetical protein [Candidatus Omnitrophota bacterium]MCM8802138.1 hypothetical protein [Candidatus Omnitrophota bacterium]